MELSSYHNITKENIIFKEAQEYQVKDSDLTYKRIPIQIKYGGKKRGPLVVETPFLFSFGVSKNLDKKFGKLTGYSIPVCLWSKDGTPKSKEKEFFDIINLLVDLSQKHLEKRYGPDLSSSLSSPLYYKQIEYTDKKGKKKTKVDESSAPILYPKIIYSEKSKKILSLFNGKKGSIDPLKYIDYNCKVKLALIIEGIFMREKQGGAGGESPATTSLQIKINECYIRDLEPRKSLITINEESDDDE